MVEHLAIWLCRYGAIVAAMALSALGVALGQGIAGAHVSQAMGRQLLAAPPSQRLLFVGLAFIESGGIFALVVTLLLLYGSPADLTLGQAVAQLGAGASVGLAASVVGIASGFVMQGAVESTARHPFFASKILSFMLLAQALLEAPAVFAFIISLLIQTQVTGGGVTSIISGVQLLFSGLIISFGAVGPAIGQSLFATAASRAIGVNPEMYSRIFSFALITQALIETPVIFALLFSLMVMFKVISGVSVYNVFASLLGAALALGFGAIGAAGGSGRVAAKTVMSMAHQPEQYSFLLRVAFLCQAIIDSALIYSLITGFILMSSL